MMVRPPLHIAAVVLAAGRSERMGAVKQLLPVGGRGSPPLLAHVVDVVLAGPFAQVVVVLGYRAAQVEEVLAGRPVLVVVNREWASGLSSSLRCGLDALAPAVRAAVFVLADQPGITVRLLERLVAAYADTRAPIVAPAHQGQWGNPVLFDRSLFAELRSQTGDKGGRELLWKYRGRVATVAVEDVRELWDLDTPEDHQRWLWPGPANNMEEDRE